MRASRFGSIGTLRSLALLGSAPLLGSTVLLGGCAMIKNGRTWAIAVQTFHEPAPQLPPESHPY